ncbi:TPA: hypothetical protein DDW35_03170 [Candidatus Sumerlaeota bacterium]|jgi:hypothetical protein|nr:hypothetical protein [Candidatus Sumerlaeota bacterium]
MAARNQVPAWVYFILLLVILLTAWLNRYRYHGTNQRQNRFTGEVEQRVVIDDTRVEWHVVPNGRLDIPEGTGMIKILDRPPKN